MSFAIVVSALLLLGCCLAARALTANANVTVVDTALPTAHPVAAGVRIFRNALVGRDPAGHAKPFEAGDLFIGMANAEANNTSGNAGAINVECWLGIRIVYTLASVAITDVGKAAYATDDGTLALTGHPDAYVGRIRGVDGTNLAIVDLIAKVGERAPNDGSSIDIDIDFARQVPADADESGDTVGVIGSMLKTSLVGAGLTAASTGILRNEATGEIRLLLDNDNEAENVTLETPQVFNITKGITFEATFKLQAAGSAATDDVDLGLAGLPGGITDTQRADMQATTAGFLNAVYHVDANGLDLEVRTDDNVTAGSEIDTTVNLVLQTAKQVKIIVRPAGTVEWWVAGVRVLSTTAFSVGASGLLAGIVNLEKSTGAGVPEVRVSRLRVAGALA